MANALVLTAVPCKSNMVRPLLEAVLDLVVVKTQELVKNRLLSSPELHVDFSVPAMMEEKH